MGPGVGIFSNLGFGITIIQGQFSWAPHHGYQLLWKDVRPDHVLSVLSCSALKLPAHDFCLMQAAIVVKS